jgi:hypothetical protein
MKKLIIGALETCSLPELAINDLQIRVDTGAKTSSLHVDDIEKERKDGKLGASFNIHPDIYDVHKIVRCWAPIVDVRQIKSSNGSSEQRLVIKTLFKLGDVEKEIEVTLTDRSGMSYLMLLGRQGMGTDFLVDPSESFLVSD